MQQVLYPGQNVLITGLVSQYYGETYIACIGI